MCSGFVMPVFKLLALHGTRLILKTLEDNGRVKYSDIVKVVGSPSTTSRALKAMEMQDLIAKEVSSEPYRPVFYFLTKRGKSLISFVEQLEEFDKAS